MTTKDRTAKTAKTAKTATTPTPTAAAPSTSAEPLSPPVWLTADEVADEFRVDRRTIYQAAKRGELRGIQIGNRAGHWRFQRAWIDSWIDWLSEQALAGAKEGNNGRRPATDPEGDDDPTLS